MLYCKGAAEIVSRLCNKYYAADGTVKEIDAGMRKQLEQTISDYADEALRTLCIAERQVRR